MKTKTDGFPGFAPAAFGFFTQLAKHNDREWFQEHKETYEASMDRLKGLKGTEFDVAFIAKEIEHHQKMIDAVDNKFLASAKNAELRQFLTELKPSLQSHLDQARALEKKLALGN